LSITVTNIAPYNGSMSLRDVQTGEILPPNNMQVWHVDEDQELELLGFVDDSPNDMPTLRYEWQPDLDVDPTWFETTDGPESVVPVSWDTNGPHVIAMQAFDDDGESSGTVSGWVWVHNVAPTIEISEDPLPLREDQRTLFTAEYSDTSSDMDTLVACWDLDPFINLDQDGSSDDDCDVTGPTINHRWSEAGNYQTIFHVTDDDGERASQVVEFTVRNQAPNAEIWVSKVGPSAGENVGLSGNLSTDDATDKPNLVYRWDLDTSVDSDGDTDPMNDIDEVGMEIWVVFDEPGERGIRLMVSDESETSTKDYTIVVMEEEGGFFGFIGGGGLVSTVVIILGLVLAGLLGVLALTSIRGRDDGGDSWDQLPSMEMATEPELPMAAPASNMFEAPAAAPVQTVAPGAPPVPVEGLPPGWTMEQWNHYGAQWLEQQASQQPQPTTVQETASLPNITNDTLPINPAEDDLDLDF
ncbi:MAG: PKD domain-containing protein, partial [Candidatus Thermoplasmatota archaeon]|nr:PKD domain-containing protein [Candidatus Thermoplasmatota archaeon]